MKVDPLLSLYGKGEDRGGGGGGGGCSATRAGLTFVLALPSLCTYRCIQVRQPAAAAAMCVRGLYNLLQELPQPYAMGDEAGDCLMGESGAKCDFQEDQSEIHKIINP